MEVMEVTEVMKVTKVMEVMKVTEVMKVIEVMEVMKVMEVMEVMKVMEMMGSTVAQWLALSPHSKKALGSNPGRPGRSRSFQVLSVWSLLVLVFSSCSPHVLLVSAWVSSGSSGFPHHHKDMHRSLTPARMDVNECWWWGRGRRR